MNKILKYIKKIPCVLGLHWWGYNHTIRPSEETLIQRPGTEQIVEEIIHDRKCKLCGKYEVIRHYKWDTEKRHFYEIKNE